MAEILFAELSYQIIGAALEVHKLLGPGYLEAVYHGALALELRLYGIPFEQHKKLPVFYKGTEIGYYEADFVVDNKIILELKAVAALHPSHKSQAIHYLTTTKLQLAILLNFGAESLERERVIRWQK